MDISKIYDDTEFDGLSGPAIQQKAQEVKQRFDLLRTSFHQLRNNIYYSNQIIDINRDVNDFDRNQFTPWNQQWNNIHRSANIISIKKYFSDGLIKFKVLEDKFNSYEPEMPQSPDIETLKNELFEKIETDFINLQVDINSKIEKGIQDLVDFKSELGLQENFATNIENENKKAKDQRLFFLILFILSILGILAIFFFMPEIKDSTIESIIKGLLTRIGVSLPVGFLSYFFFNQYKLYQIMTLRYTHLNGFIGGGATYLSQIIKNDEDSKKAINIKLANLFMEIDDVIGTVRRSNHPMDDSIDNAIKAYKTITDGVSNIAKNVK